MFQSQQTTYLSDTYLLIYPGPPLLLVDFLPYQLHIFTHRHTYGPKLVQVATQHIFFHVCSIAVILRQHSILCSLKWMYDDKLGVIRLEITNFLLRHGKTDIHVYVNSIISIC